MKSEIQLEKNETDPGADFWSPDQIVKCETDASADIWSRGVVLTGWGSADL